jgi:hypothetical protein
MTDSFGPTLTGERYEAPRAVRLSDAKCAAGGCYVGSNHTTPSGNCESGSAPTKHCTTGGAPA